MTAEPSVSPRATVDERSSGRSQPIPRWRERPERAAWIVLLLSFACFLFLVTSIPLAVRNLYHTAAAKQSLQFETTLGTVLLYPPNSDQPIALTERREGISEGSRLETGAATQGVLGLPAGGQSDELMGTILLYPNSTLEVVMSRRPYFAGSNEPYTLRIRVQEGQVRLFTRSAFDRPVEVQIETPQGEAQLEEGNYAFFVNADSSEIVVKQGVARIFRPGLEPVEIEPGLRSWIQADGTILPAVAAVHNLLQDSAFTRPLGEVWESYTPPYVTPGTVDFIEKDGRQAARFSYRGPDQTHTEIGIRQVVDQDVHNYDSLVVKLDVNLDWQTLAGAGEQSSEFPLRVEITFTDIFGKERRWGHGFYNMDPLPSYPLFGGEQVPLFNWHSYESENLMELLDATPPAHIDSVKLYASGWNYLSFASDLELIVE
ncbi:MAG: hypothetical protein OXH93_07515 [Caldilineaceae bacterium]|nr:hypothetical protein [Caldilineaceae bacterium]